MEDKIKKYRLIENPSIKNNNGICVEELIIEIANALREKGLMY